MKNLCKKTLALLMIITIFTTYVPAISTIVWAIEDINNETKNQMIDENTDEKEHDTVIEETNTVNEDDEQLNDNITEKPKTITEAIEEKSQEQAKGIMQNQEIQKTESQEEQSTKGNRNLDEDTIINLDEKIKRALNNSSYYYDLNNDGEYSIKELSNENLKYIDIDCQDSTVDLTGVQYMVNLTEFFIDSLSGNIDVSELPNLPNLEHVGIFGEIGNIDNLELLTNLKWLELSNNTYNKKLNINDKLPSLVSLEYLSIQGYCTLDPTKLLNLTKLTNLTIGGWYTDELLDFAALGNVTSLEYLTIRYFKVDDMSGLENLTNLRSLSIALQEGEGIDAETIVSLENLTFLQIENFDSTNMQWLSGLNNIQSLYLTNYNPDENISSDFIDMLNNLDVEYISLNVSAVYDLGEIEPDIETEIDFHDIPLVNALIDPNNKLYASGFAMNTSNYDGTENELRVDNENGKIYLTAGEKNRRYDYVYGNIGMSIKLQWSFETDSNVPVISETLRQALIDNGFDENNDGVLTFSELNSEQHSYLNIYFNNNDSLDLTGIENLQNLYGLSLASYNREMNLSYIEGLTNLKSLNLSGKFNTSSLKKLTGLTELSLNLYSNNSNNILTDIKDLTNLQTLSLYGLGNESLSPINNLTNLSVLRISYANPEIININEISNLNNLDELQLSDVDASDLSGLENLESLRKLSIEQADAFIDSIDIETLQELDNLEELSITAINDLSWVNSLTNLEEFTINGRYGGSGTELTQEYLNMLKNISAKVIFNGQFYYDLGNYAVGSQFEKNLNELPIFQEMNDPNSKFHVYDMDIYNNYYGDHEDWSYDSTTNVLSVNVNEVNEYSTTFSINYYTSAGFCYMSLCLSWRGCIDGNKTPITIVDDNLRQELLDNYDIDGDGVITEHDMVNASYIELVNKNITDLTGLEYATNARWIDLYGNNISDVTPIIDILTSGDCMVYLENNLIDSLDGMENINFERVDLSNNYIDFSDESENLQLVEEYATNYANEEYERNKNEIQGITKQRYTEYIKQSIINSCKWQKYGSVSEREDVLQFEDALYNRLVEIGFDLNSDGSLTKGELNDFCYVEGYYDTIDLSNLGITNIENLKYLANASSIDLSGNNIVDVSPLKECMSLYDINLSNNKIESIEGAKDYFNVNNLDLSNNKIKNITPLQYLRTAKSLFTGGNLGYYGGGGWDPIRSVCINLSNNEIEDISVLNELISISNVNLSGNKISDISSLSNYNFNALAAGFVIDEAYYQYENVTIDVTQNNIDFSDDANLAAVEYFEEFYSTIKTGNQFLSLTDDQTNITVETYGETTARIVVEEIDETEELPEEVTQHIGDMEILSAVDISIVDGTYNGKITVILPVDSKYNGKQVKVIHQKENGSIEEFSKTVENASVTVEVDELSPFYIALDENQALKGDVNGNGTVDLTDYSMILKHVKGIKTLTGEQLERADVNENGSIDLTDYSMVLKHVKGIKLLD